MCFEKLVPEVKTFLKGAGAVPEPPLSRDTYLTVRRLIDVMAQKTKTGSGFLRKVENRAIPEVSGEIPVAGRR
ncbi:MAG: hypothetical protein LBQ00_01565 [Syntrophobacterales bacterium]|nr:hypothetical protein [Syntrophobacterales bacterium]